MYCPFCGVTVGKEFLFCPSCGRQLPRHQQVRAEEPIRRQPVAQVAEDSSECQTCVSPLLALKWFFTRWTFVGRSSRSEIWWVILFVRFPVLLASFAIWGSFLSPFTIYLGLILFVPTMCLQVRRFHDIERSVGWLFAFYTVDLVVAILQLVIIHLAWSMTNRNVDFIQSWISLLWLAELVLGGIVLCCDCYGSKPHANKYGPVPNVSPRYHEKDIPEQAISTTVPDSPVLNNARVASGTDVEDREEPSKKHLEGPEEYPTEDSPDSTAILSALVFSIILIVVVGILVAAGMAAYRANSKTISSMTVFPQESTHSIQDGDVNETCEHSTIQKEGGDMTSDDDALESVKQMIADGNITTSGVDAEVLASIRQTMGIGNEKSTIKVAETIKTVNDGVDAEMVEHKVKENKEPTLRVVANIDGKEVSGAKLDDGVRKHLIPVVWKLVSKKVYGPYKVSYESGNKRYVGSFDAVTVDWHGPRMKSVVLKEDSEPWHGDIKTLTLPGGATMELIYIVPGSFMMGSSSSENGRDNDETQHRVTLTKSFWMGKYEVTRKQWASVMGATSAEWDWDTRPVDNISWDDCQFFIQKVNVHLNCRARLPTEAEWEYVCRANSIDSYNRNLDLDDMAWWHRNSGGVIHPVGEKRPNSWGFYDMYGNVSEWCNDWYASYTGPVNDPIGPAVGERRILRGGDRNSSSWDCRSASRSSAIPSRRNYGFGFRLVCSAGLLVDNNGLKNTPHRPVVPNTNRRAEETNTVIPQDLDNLLDELSNRNQ